MNRGKLTEISSMVQVKKISIVVPFAKSKIVLHVGGVDKVIYCRSLWCT